MVKFNFAITLIIGFVFVFFEGEPSFAQKQDRPNVILMIADDWGRHARVYGDSVVATPTFDRLATEGILFSKAFVSSPSCSPSRASILNGRHPHQNKEGAQLWGTLDKKLTTYTEVLEAEGYFVGRTRKGWGPGNFYPGGFDENPAGKEFPSFDHFLDKLPNNTPFVFWFGSHDPHRPYDQSLKSKIELAKENLKIPSYLPDNQIVRNDLLDYYAEVGRFDNECGELISLLESKGLLDNTLIIMTSDNGIPFPRAKGNLYDAGVMVPLAMFWKGNFEGGKVYDGFVNLAQLAPTILEVTGAKIPETMKIKSIVSNLKNPSKNDLDKEVFIERERHAYVRSANVSYPMRGIRTDDFLYIKNLRPERWPAGDPTIDGGLFGDVDDGPTKDLMISDSFREENPILFQLNFGKRPLEELYDLKSDPYQLINQANNPRYKKKKKLLEKKLTNWMIETDDPRVDPSYDGFDFFPYYGRKILMQ